MSLLALLLAVAMPSASFAQASPPPPAGLSRDQFDALVEAISKSVAEKLKGDPNPAAQIAPPAQASSATPSSMAKSLSGAPDSFSLLLKGAREVAAAIPSVGRQLRVIYGMMDQRDRGGHDAPDYLALLLLIAVVAVAGDWIVRRLLRGLQVRMAEKAGPEFGTKSLLPLGVLALVDVGAASATWAIGRAGTASLIASSPPQHQLANAILYGIFIWRLLACLFRVILRPDLPRARMCDVEDGQAQLLYRWMSAATLILLLGRMLGELFAAVGTPAVTIAAYQAIAVPVYTALFVWLVVACRTAAGKWLLGLGRSAPLAGAIGRHWLPCATVFFVAAGLTQWHGVLSGHLHVGNAMLTTLNVVLVLLLFETLMQAFVRRLDSQLAGYTPASSTPKLPDVLARCLRVALLIIAAAVVAENWIVHVFGLVDEKDWGAVTRSSRIAGFSLFAAFVLWELFKFITDPFVLAAPAGARDGSAGSPATRLHTMMRLLRTAVAIVLFVIAGLIALDDLGVNVTPLIAGASVFGIAVSFGSQALVKDIVSGIFYLYDDAFRVGEYIDCGRAKGTVEGFTLRSVRLRHQDGQVHTIPFGDLGQITNFSRDWTTRKFTLRFARDTDPERLRKVTKEIGAEMLEMPDLKGEIIEPLKMQGIEEVADNALVVRFKFVARPGNPNAVQNDAVTRLLKALPERGIEFAR